VYSRRRSVSKFENGSCSNVCLGISRALLQQPWIRALNGHWEPDAAALHDSSVHAMQAQWPSLSLQAPYKNQLEGLLLNNVMPCFDSPYGHLRAKACWVAGQYADIDFREGSGQGHTFNSLFQKVVNAFQDPDLPVGIPL